MLTNTCFLPNLVELSKPASFLTSIGFYWKSKISKFHPMNHRRFYMHKITTKIHLFLLLLIAIQTGLSKEPNVSRKMISSFGLIVVLFCGITVQIYHKNLGKCVSLINELIRMSMDLEKDTGSSNHGCCNQLDTKEKFIKLLAPTLHWSAMAVPFAFVGGVVWSMPCMPSNLGYFLLEQCSTSQPPVEPTKGTCPAHLFLPKGIFLIINLWIWSYGVQCAVFVVIVVMLGAMSLRSFLKYYHRSMLDADVTVCRPLPSSSQVLRNYAVMYRRIQLLTNNFNAIHKSKILVPLVFTVTSHQVFSVYGAIKFAGQLNFVSYALFLILGSQGILVIMGMFTGLADVYTMSRRVKGRLQKAQRCHRWLRRFHMSCQLIKIRFGALNFIDSFTPLAFENFAVVQTTNMLMVE